MACQEYRCVYGEDAESALRFLFSATSAKADNLLQGIPAMIYPDNGPVARSLVFRTVKEAHETLYHFHKPETEAEANAWPANFVSRYNDKPHRRERHNRRSLHKPLPLWRRRSASLGRPSEVRCSLQQRQTLYL